MSNVPLLGPYAEACKEAFELIEVDEKLTSKIREASPSEFTPIGTVALGGDDFAVHAGIKRRIAVHYTSVAERVAREILVGDELLTHKPQRVQSLPAFVIPVFEKDGKSVGILTEDFTEGGIQHLEEDYWRFGTFRTERKDIPEGLTLDVYDALEGQVYMEALGHTQGRVGSSGVEVLIDFDEVPDNSIVKEKIGPYEEFAQAIAITLA